MIASSIITAIDSLQAQCAAAAPLQNAAVTTLTALRLNADNLVIDLDNAMIAAAGTLDTWVAPVDPQAIISGEIALTINAIDQQALALMRSVIGRVASNLNLL